MEYNEQQATPAQIKAIQKLKLHPRPWELTKREAWKLMDDNINKNGNAPQPSDQPSKVQPKASTKEFHLSVEQVNTNALNAAIELMKETTNGYPSDELMATAKGFKEFIENGN
ncbi:MAG: hypothetical protein ACTSQE_14750 [Candidatus Heimdallarchaeaceae archaeon]